MKNGFQKLTAIFMTVLMFLAVIPVSAWGAERYSNSVVPGISVLSILPGDTNGLVYLNGEAVYLPHPLSAYDVIEMGESTFLFVPFCGEHYMWEDDK